MPCSRSWSSSFLSECVNASRGCDVRFRVTAKRAAGDNFPRSTVNTFFTHQLPTAMYHAWYQSLYWTTIFGEEEEACHPNRRLSRGTCIYCRISFSYAKTPPKLTIDRLQHTKSPIVTSFGNILRVHHFKYSLPDDHVLRQPYLTQRWHFEILPQKHLSRDTEPSGTSLAVADGVTAIQIRECCRSLERSWSSYRWAKFVIQQKKI